MDLRQTRGQQLEIGPVKLTKQVNDTVVPDVGIEAVKSPLLRLNLTG